MNNIPPVIAPPAPAPRRCGLAVASLVMGIASYFTCGLLILPAIICGALALSQISRAQGALTGRGQALAGIILGGVCVLVLVVAIPFAAALAMPALVKARDQALAASCLTNLKLMGTSCLQYAAEHNGTLPARLEDVPALPGMAGRFVAQCPAAPPGTGASYRLLLPGQRLSDLADPARAPLICETAKRHSRGYGVVFADGHAEFLAHLPQRAAQRPDDLKRERPPSRAPPPRTERYPPPATGMAPPPVPAPGAPAGMSVTTALTELNSGDLDRAGRALAFLKQTPLADDQRPAVIQAALHFVQGTVIEVRSAHKFNDAARLRGDLRATNAGPAVARGLTSIFTASTAQQVLGQLGAEQAVQSYLQHSDWRVRVTACKTLANIGTAASRPALQQAAQDKNRFVVQAATDALQAVNSRKE